MGLCAYCERGGGGVKQGERRAIIGGQLGKPILRAIARRMMRTDRRISAFEVTRLWKSNWSVRLNRRLKKPCWECLIRL